LGKTRHSHKSLAIDQNYPWVESCKTQHPGLRGKPISFDWLQQERSVYWLEQLKIQKLAHKTGQTYQVWQEGSHPQAIANEAMLIQFL
jgi:hypothetical protein